MDGRWSDRLAQNARFVNVSLNGASKATHELVNRGSLFERVIENVQMLKVARDACGSGLVIGGHMTITTSNVHEIPLFLTSFERFGFDRVNFGYVKETVPAYLAGNPGLWERLRNEVSEAMSHVPERSVDELRLRMLGLTGESRSVENRVPQSIVPLPVLN